MSLKSFQYVQSGGGGGGSGTVTSVDASASNGFSFSGGPITTAGTLVFTAANVSVTSVQSANAFYSKGVFDTAYNTYTDGIVVDYSTGNGRISVGAADNITFYNGGVANVTLGTAYSNGTWSFANASPTLNNLGGIGIGKAIAMAIIFGGG
jgi:hypothetical protein